MIVNKIINHVLRQSLNAQTHLQRLQHRSLCIQFNDISFEIWMRFNCEGIECSLFPFKDAVNHSNVADVILKGPLASFVTLFNHPNLGRIPPGIETEGDISLAADVRTLFLQSDIDWEEVVAPYLGDVAAHALGQTLRNVKMQWLQKGDRLKFNLKEYLEEESNLLPSESMIQAFMTSIDTLVDDVSRLEAKVAWLENRIDKDKPCH